MTLHVTLQVLDSSHAGEARRVAVGFASALGFDASDSGRVALVVTEAATNIVKHAGKGLLLLRKLEPVGGKGGIEVLALDRGPGMQDVARCMADGYSTAGSPGTGLGALFRLASFVDVYSAPGLGTALLARILAAGAREPPTQGPLRCGAVRVAAPGETQCGDDFDLVQEGRRAMLAVADGLGHGEHAATAAGEAMRSFRKNALRPPEELLEGMHRALLATRGAACSVADIDFSAGQVCYAGVGNVAGFMAWPGGSRSMVSQNGTLGGHIGRLRSQQYAWQPGSALVLHTDGLTSHTALQAYPGLLARHPSLIAGVLYRDFVRGRDDATVVVARESDG